MDNISLIDFAVILVVAIALGFFAGSLYEQCRFARQFKRFPKEDCIDHVDPVKERPVSRYQMEQARGMRNIYGTAWHNESILDEMMREYAAAIYRGTTTDDEKPN